MRVKVNVKETEHREHGILSKLKKVIGEKKTEIVKVKVKVK